MYLTHEERDMLIALIETQDYEDSPELASILSKARGERRLSNYVPPSWLSGEPSGSKLTSDANPVPKAKRPHTAPAIPQVDLYSLGLIK